MKFKILCFFASTFISQTCLSGFTVWELVNSRGQTNYVVEAELTEPSDYVTQSGMYFVSRYMKQVRFFEGRESLPWILNDKSKGSFMLNLSSGNLYFISHRGTRFGMNRAVPNTWRLCDFNATASNLKDLDQTSLVKKFLKEVFLVKETEETAEDHLHVY